MEATSMPVAPDEAPANISQVLRRNYMVLSALLAGRVLVSVILIRFGLVMEWVPGLTGAVIVSGVMIAITTFYRITCGLRLRAAALVLREYPLQWCDSLDKKSKKWTEYGSVFTLRVAHQGEYVTPDMLARRAAGPSRWPGGTEGGVWFAGDPLFGGVVIIPGNKAVMFMVPAEWKALAEEREQASPERVEKAKAAKIFKMSWRRANLQT